MLLSLFLFTLMAHAVIGASDAFRVVCYYTNWAQYRPGKGMFLPEDIDPSLCTIISYAFAKPNGLNLTGVESNDDGTSDVNGMQSRVIKLKLKNPNLKIILAVGGYSVGSAPFIPIVDKVKSRAQFIRNTIKYLRERDFDGLDMDWEYPAFYGSPPTDKAKFQLLMEDMWHAFHVEGQVNKKPRLLLGAAVAANKETIDKAYFVANLSRVVDFISIMSYEFHGAWETFVGFNSPLYAHSHETGNARNLNVDWVAKYYVSLGAPKEKLNIGIATYGRSFTLADPNRHGILSAASGRGTPAPFTREAGTMSYYEVCDMVYSGATVVEVSEQKNRYIYKDDQWVGYEDADSVTEKACYAKQGGFGGIIVWTLDYDDFKGVSCNEGAKRFVGKPQPLKPLSVLETGVKDFRFICYYTNWAQYRPDKGMFLPENIDPNLCTIISYAFAKPDGLNLKAFEWNDEDTNSSKGMYSRVMKMKEKNPSVKVILAAGGYTMGSAPFVPLVQTAESRTAFAKNVTQFLRARKFDGFDMDWEFPTTRESLPSDKPKFQKLMEELWKTFREESVISKKPRLILGVAVSAGKDTIDKAYYVANLSRCVDFISIMTYDLHGAWESFVGFHSPLYAFTQETGTARYLNLDWAAKYYVSLGAPKEKLNIGIATYGRSFSLADPNRFDVLSAAIGAGSAAPYSRESGVMSYYEVCDFINSGANVVKVDSQRNPYAHKGNQWVGYDDVESITEKACYIKDNEYGGMLVWTIDFDDFKGTSCNQGAYPLLNAARSVLKPKPKDNHKPNSANICLAIICYYTNWSQFRTGKGRYLPEDIDPKLCTIISYAFAKPSGLDLKIFEWNDDDTTWSEGMYRRVIKMKKKNPKVKVILAIGGYHMGSQPFIPLAQTDESRKAFARNAIYFLRGRSFDGLDMNWEYPTRNGSLASDKPKFQKLMEELWRAFEEEAAQTGRPRLLLGVAVAAGKEIIDDAYYVANLSRCTDFISLMTYDFHGSWENFVAFNSPLYAYVGDTGPSSYLTVDWVARYYVSLGAPKEKLNIGIATYGRSFTLAEPRIHSVYSPATSPGLPGIYTTVDGVLAYYEVCQFIENGAIVLNVPSQGNPYAVKDNQWVGYDDPQSATDKACYAIQRGFGGVVIWTLDFDDFRGEFCNQGHYPITRAVNNVVKYPERACNGVGGSLALAAMMADGVEHLQYIDMKLLLWVEVLLLWPVYSRYSH